MILYILIMVDAAQSEMLLKELEDMEKQILQNQKQMQQSIDRSIAKEKSYLMDIYRDCVREERTHLDLLKEELSSKLTKYYNSVQEELKEEIKPTDKDSVKEMQTQLSKIREYTQTFNEILEHKLITNNELSNKVNFNKLIPPYEKHKFPLQIHNGVFRKELMLFKKTPCVCVMARDAQSKMYSIALSVEGERKGLMRVEFKLQREPFKAKSSIEEDDHELSELKVSSFVQESSVVEGNIYICTVKVRFTNYYELLRFNGQEAEFYTFSVKKMQRANSPAKRTSTDSNTASNQREV